MPQPQIAAGFVIVVVLFSATLTEGQGIGTACSAGGGECGTGLNLECFAGLSICVCATGYSNDGTNNCAYDCGALAPPANGAVSTVLGTTEGDPASYSCNAGYKLNGVASRTCTTTGWSDADPTCDRGQVGDDCSVDGNLCNLVAFGFCDGAACVCNAGYTAANGDTACTEIDECASNPCENGGTCTNNINSFSCACADGYADTTCSTNIDECASNPCQNGATCNDLVNSYTCSCVAGYADTHCETDIDECASGPCQNFGTCTDIVNGYTCACFNGFADANCATNIDDCDPNPCQNGATCTDGIAAYTCTCVPGYADTDCQTDIDECASSPCQNGGTCTDAVNGYTCACVNGYAGDNCETNIDECTPDPCLNGGTCTDGIATFTCSCVAGYADGTCSTNIDECASTPCNNGGTCFDNINFFTCGCVAGYTDLQCSTNIDECASAPCQNSGTCLDAINSYSCVCVSGYAGTNCEQDVDECASSPCLNDGVCADNVNAFVCTCGPGFTDTNCRASVLGDDCSTRDNICFNIASAECAAGVCSCISGYENLGSGVCTPVECGALLGPTNGNVDLSAGTEYSNIATFSCNPGYTLTGDTSRTCEADASWGGTSPTCTINDCNTLVPPSNGQVNHPVTTYLSQATYSCDTGYTLLGEVTRTCQADSIWSGSTPSCIINDCGSLTAPTNGVVTYNPNTKYQGVAEFACNTGYTMVGLAQRTCQDDSTWDSVSPTCDINVCPDLTAPAQGAFTRSDLNNYLSVATFTCVTGYTLSGSSSLVCLSTSSWDNTVPNCVINDCSTLSAPENGAIDLSDGTTYLSVITFSCNSGYDLQGFTTRTCQADSQWNNADPTCLIKNCGSVSDPIDGSVDLSAGTTYQSILTYTCDNGYTINGHATRTCQADGLWSGTDPTCDINECGTLLPPTDGTVDLSDGTVFESVAIYACDSGYTLTGATTRTCQASSTWSDAEPSCVVKDCGSPPAPTNGQVTAADGTTYTKNALYLCDTGYDLIGSTTRECGGTGAWDGTTPTCQIKDCGVLAPLVSGTVTTASGTLYGATAVYACDTGYELNGASTRVCQPTGLWSDAAATCTIKSCLALTDPDHGSFTLSDGYYYQSVATFDCDSGYTLSGILQRTCMADETFNGSSPTCIINDCGTVPAPTNGAIDMSGGTTYLSAVTFSCDSGYTLSDTQSLTCQADSTWNNISPTCDINNCGTAASITNGQVSTSLGTTFGQAAVYTCDTGYTLTGTDVRYCTAAGSWEVPSPTCVIKDCGNLASPADGSVSLTGTQYQDTVTYTCDAGFDLNGFSTRTCGGDALWTNSEPTCERKSCGTLPIPINGAVSSTGTDFESVATYTCNAGYDLSGATTRTCQSSGNWDGVAPTCAIKDCGSPTAHSFGSVTTSGGTTYGETAVYTCNTGYQLIGDATRTCEADGGWSGTSPTCTIQDCGTLATPVNGALTYLTGTTTYNSEVVYNCDTGYQVNGVETRICQHNGDWSDSPASCILRDCTTPFTVDNAIVTDLQGTSFGATVTYACNSGYGMVGDATVSCESDGEWSARPTCIKDCGTPVTIENGAYTTPSGTLVGGVASYTCSGGYLMSGTADITCPSGGSWPTEPFCALITTVFNETCSTDLQCGTEAAVCRNDGNGANRCLCELTGYLYDSTIDICLKVCVSLAAPTNGDIERPENTAVGQIVTYSCHTGYALDGVTIRTCLSTGEWSDTAPVCTTGCPVPTPPSNGYVNVTTYIAGSIATYTCMEGHSLVGSSERICLTDSQWNGNQPYCYIECPSLSPIKNGNVDMSSGDWQESVATYICNNDYALVGAPTRKCQASGIWDGVEPECIFAIFPDILLIFGSLFAVLVIIDIFVIVIVIYFKYCRKKPESNADFDKIDEQEDPDINNALNPVFVTPGHDMTRNSMRKSRHAKISPEVETQRSRHVHPPPKKIPSDRKPERSTYFFRDNKQSSLPMKLLGNNAQANGPGHTKFRMDPKPAPVPLPLSHAPAFTMQERGKKDMKEHATNEYKNEQITQDNYAHSDGSSHRGAPSVPEDDQFSLDFDQNYGRDTDRPDVKGDTSLQQKKGSPVDDPNHVFKGRLHPPIGPDWAIQAGKEEERMYIEGRRKLMKKAVSTYSPAQGAKT